MRRLAAGSVASYGTVVALTTAEGTLQFMIPPYLEHADYPISAIGFLYGLPFAVALAFRAPAGVLYRGSRARLLVATAAVSTAATALLLTHAPGPLAFGTLQVVHGIALAVSTTVTLAHFLGTHGTGAGRARAMGYYTTALSGGYMIGNSASGLIAAQWGYGGALASAGVWSLLAAALALGLPPVIAADPARARAPRAGGWAGARRAFGDPGLLYAGSVAFLLSLLFHVPGTFFPLYGLGASLAVVEIGFIRTAYSFTNTAVRGFCGAVLERVGRPQAEIVAIVCQVAALAVVPLFNAFGALLACLVFVAFWRAVGLVANTMSLAEDVDPRRVGRGVASGVFNAANDVGGLVAPALGGLVAGLFGLENVFRALPGLVLLSYALVVGTLGRTTRRTTMGAPVEPSRS